jgi:NAD(P)-dependent dehydrogenase (short-subunit alcohol dehydrogenase family)
VAALELGPRGVRVNMVHPHAVMDTALWTPEILRSRAERYGLSVEEYERNNLIKVEVRSKDVAELLAAMAGPLFAKTTGAQLAADKQWREVSIGRSCSTCPAAHECA